MKISISNIAWDIEQDNSVYALMEKYGYQGLEIAPSRIIPDSPYDNLEYITKWKKDLNRKRKLLISSMQSIWYGKSENIFSSDEERKELMAYTKKAVIFAEQISCKNLVFGCPKNRKVPDNMDPMQIAIPFFKEAADFAARHNTVIGLEAVSIIYNTNFINDTLSAIEFIKEVNSKGLKLNLDVGTMIQNKEDLSVVENNIHYVNHVHISEPRLAGIVRRSIHTELKDLLKRENYDGYISIEMSKGHPIENVMEYISMVFGD